VITGIEHSAIAAADPVGLAGWYSSVLGFDIVYQSANALFVRAANGAMIEIIRAEGERPAQLMRTPGHRHLAISVTGFDAVYASLKARGVRFVTEPEESKGNKVAFFTDPEGNFLHLLERAKPLV
jgi:catechol 2,3-dioxygenase-like lactoylglutathione lyase family enzyme